MVFYTALLMLACCTCLQHTGAQLTGPWALARYKRGAAGKLVMKPGSKTTSVNKKGPQPPEAIPALHCSVDLIKNNNHFLNLPWILKGTPVTGYEIVLPEPAFYPRVPIPLGSILTFSCPGGNVIVLDSNVVPMSGVSGIEVQCITDSHGQHILVDTSSQTPMKWIGCSKKIANSIQSPPYEKCGNGDLIKIGFSSYGGFFFPQIDVCFFDNLKTTLWTRHTLHGDNFSELSKDGTGSWKADALYGNPNILTWEDFYDTTTQSNLLNNKLKWNAIHPANQPFNNGLYFAKGHLSPNADFVTTAEREATFHYINAVPQWQAVNNGNWKNIVEASVQTLAKKLQTDLIIMTGGHGILKLNGVPIFLDEPNQLPAPELMWKVVFNPLTNEGVAFVVNNNPYLVSPPPRLCTTDSDVCGSLSKEWFNAHLDRNNYHAGYTYCCDVADLFDNLPINTYPTHYKNFDLRNAIPLTGGSLSGK